ncbi:MAG: isocitrate dehydrogenase (NADP(+)) [Candidatus Palauibacterales bacterium]|nr:isocitrate dehydrogenase (NADP(+)) [Candidatus Palauibacterales bacterium]
MSTYQYASVPDDGERITEADGELQVPDRPILPFIEGDGIGPDIWNATRPVFDAAVEEVYGGDREIVWMEVFAGEKAREKTGEWIPEETFQSIRDFRVGIKGPLTTPVGGGIRSLNVTLRQVLDLYACVRRSRWLPGTPSPVSEPEKVDITVYRENTEDVYSGIEWEAGTEECEKVRSFLMDEMGEDVREGSGIGVKPISEFGTKRLVAMAIEDAIRDGRTSVTLVHKGNIMKFTEGAFREWGYEVARERFPERTITEDELWDEHDGERPDGKIVIKDRIADQMFQQVLLRPDEYDYCAMPNLNGDYLSDALAAQVGGLGMAPGGNIGDGRALFEATHGTAPKYEGMDKVNPTSLILSGVAMLKYMGWGEAARAIEDAIVETIQEKYVTYDLERQMEGATKVKTSEFGQRIVEHIRDGA